MAYLATWIIIIFIQVVVLYKYYIDNLGLAISDAMVFNLLFALLGLAVWYPAWFTTPEKKNIVNLTINLITSLIILLLVWGSLSYFILISAISDTEYHDFLRSSITWRIVAGIILYLFLVFTYYLIIYYNDLHQRQVSEAKLLGSLKEAELNLLKSQINPHFLFNSLNSISSLTITNAEKAHEMVIKLSDFLRYTVTAENHKFTSLDQEIDNIRRYLDIENVRFGDKLQFEFDIDEICLKQQLPSMILQPLFENAIKHGVYESSEPIFIHMSGKIRSGFMEILIRNNFEPGPGLKKGAGMGLKNIKERMKLLYHTDQLVSIQKTDDEFEVQLLIPGMANE